jgi:peptidoglycan/xylan/chitin deacetylase (PgdA/CDA1 family)
MFVLWTTSLAAQNRSVAITIDDLPFVTSDASRPMGPQDAEAAMAATRKMLDVLKQHHVPVTGFVIQKSVEKLGVPAGTAMLREWTTGGFDLGNHSYAHPSFNDLTVAEMEDQVVRGEATFAPLMREAGRKVEFFRFPYNQTGDTREKHDAVAAFLAGRGYKLAPCTIEDEDWIFTQKYFLTMARKDDAATVRLSNDYLKFLAAQVDYFAGLNKQIFGYEPPEVMLLHANQLNADSMEKILGVFEARGYRFVSLGTAEADPAYRTPETFITDKGPMWSYRWAKVLGVKVDGSKEPEPAPWVAAYGTGEPPAPARPQ